MSRDIRRELLDVLAELSEACPEVRLGQLVTNLSYLASGPSNSAAWDVEDEDLLNAAREHLKEWRSRCGTAAKAG
jgi:hypothetical protein